MSLSWTAFDIVLLCGFNVRFVVANQICKFILLMFIFSCLMRETSKGKRVLGVMPERRKRPGKCFEKGSLVEILV